MLEAKNALMAKLKNQDPVSAAEQLKVRYVYPTPNV